MAFFRTLAALILMAGFCAPAIAQTPENQDPQFAAFVDALRGQWEVVDPDLPPGKQRCRLDLGTSDQPAALPVRNDGCIGVLADLVGWTIRSQQMALISRSGATIALLGGSERRLTGQTEDGKPIVMERPTQQAAAPAPVAPGGECIYYGYTATCAQARDLGAPTFTSGNSQVSVLVKLNMRQRPDVNAPVVNVIAPDTCVMASRCSDTATGLWCQIQAGPENGWIKKNVVRQSRWPIVTFANRCG